MRFKDEVYSIHRGYARLLAGFNADIEHARANHSGNALFRQTYVEKVVDAFAQELRSRPPGKRALMWRSRVLNPILQRQFHGYCDHESPMLQAHFDKLAGEDLDNAIINFYLARDPLDADQQQPLRRGILYVTAPRRFLGLEQSLWQDPSHYEKCRRNTSTLLKHLAEAESPEADEVLEAELKVIVAEMLESYYRDDLDEVGCSLLWCLFDLF